MRSKRRLMKVDGGECLSNVEQRRRHRGRGPSLILSLGGRLGPAMGPDGVFRAAIIAKRSCCSSGQMKPSLTRPSIVYHGAPVDVRIARLFNSSAMPA